MIGVKKAVIQRGFWRENEEERYQSQDVIRFEGIPREVPTDADKRRVSKR